MGTTPSFASAGEALDMVLAGLRFLADADAAPMAAGEQAGCLQRLERVTSVVAAARSSVLDVDPDAFEDLVRLCVELDKLWHGAGPAGAVDGGAAVDGSAPGDGCPHPGPALQPGGTGSGMAWPTARRRGTRAGTAQSREALEQAIVGKAAALLSGPGGLASFLRRNQLGTRLGGPSLPLDIGYADTVPASIRRAVRLRDRHCQWAGGCAQPAAACDVHHVRHQADGGQTSLGNCMLLCRFHHLIVIHRWGWTLVLNPDGTTTAWNKDKTRILHSHSPQPAPGNPPGPGGLVAPGRSHPISPVRARRTAGPAAARTSVILSAQSPPVSRAGQCPQDPQRLHPLLAESAGVERARRLVEVSERQEGLH